MKSPGAIPALHARAANSHVNALLPAMHRRLPIPPHANLLPRGGPVPSGPQRITDPRRTPSMAAAGATAGVLRRGMDAFDTSSAEDAGGSRRSVDLSGVSFNCSTNRIRRSLPQQVVADQRRCRSALDARVPTQGSKALPPLKVPGPG
jgi:hypothetical protein